MGMYGVLCGGFGKFGRLGVNCGRFGWRKFGLELVRSVNTLGGEFTGSSTETSSG